MSNLPSPPSMTPVQRAFENRSRSRDLTAFGAWRWFEGLIREELETLAKDVLCNLQPGADRDAAILRYRTLKYAIEMPERLFQGAQLVIDALPRKDDLEAGDVPLSE